MTCNNYEDGSDVLIAQSAAGGECQQRQDVVERNDSDSPPDGGWGWVVCLGVSVVNFLTVGQQNSAGVIYDALMEEYSTSRGETGNGKNCLLQRSRRVSWFHILLLAPPILSSKQ